MLQRTQAWLLGQQKPDGSWPGDMSEFFTFHTSTLRNTAFVVWALAANGYQGAEIDRGLDYVDQQLSSDETDPYTLALVANAFALAAPSDPRTSDPIDRLDGEADRRRQDPLGQRRHADRFYGAGNDADVTTTALAAHALLTAGGHAGSVEGALEFLTRSNDTNGNFGSTQATIWSLKALLLAASKGTEGAVGDFAVSLDGQPFDNVKLTEDKADVMTRFDMSALATTGDRTVGLDFAARGRSATTWSAVTTSRGPTCRRRRPDRSRSRCLRPHHARGRRDRERDGHDPEPHRRRRDMILVTVGIPPGFEVLTEDLGQYLSGGQLSNYELTGKQLILYLTELQPNASQAFHYRLRATMPVRAVDGGAKVFPYYEPDQKSDTASQQLVSTIQ